MKKISKHKTPPDLFDSPDLWSEALNRALDEDHWFFDWTSRSVAQTRKTHGRSAKPAVAELRAKESGVWACSGLAEVVRRRGCAIGGEVSVVSHVQNGERFSKGDVILTLKGSHETILVLERGMINLASYSCAIATATNQLVQVVKQASSQWSATHEMPRVTATRKTLPFYKDIAIHSVLMGGGFSHRVNLAGGVLLKENHVAAAGSITKAVALAKSTVPHVFRVEVEVTSLKELTEALEAKADGVLLDNFSPALVSQAVSQIKKSGANCVTEVSGGLNVSNLAGYVQPGVHVLSVGSLTHSVKALDLSLVFKGASTW